MSNALPPLLLVRVKQEEVNMKEECASTFASQHPVVSNESYCADSRNEWQPPPSPTLSALSNEYNTFLLPTSAAFNMPKDQLNTTSYVSASIKMLITGEGLAQNTPEITYPQYEPKNLSCIKCTDDLEGERCPVSPPNVRTHRCQFCGDSFALSGLLKRHVDFVHRDQRPIACEVCGKEFTRKKNLTEHINVIHKGMRTCVCEVCGEAFAWKSVMNRHINAIHKDLRTFVCEMCGKAFRQRATLNHHVDAIHKGLRAFVCEECGETFAWRSALNQHVNAIHKKLRNCVCEVCGKAFTRKAALNRHLDLIHKDPPE